ncbi:MAG TPA: MHYT domain-containing protein [Streptosporangiaceae bacterium]|nr:MHYT domain-containing protein [Streptosporangiaceae bacterium]
METHHFTFGALTPGLAYIMSCAGSLLGLLCTTRAQVLTGRPRIQWLMAGALAIGGTGIWVMHFIGMLGFSAAFTVIRYDIPLTLFSAVIAIAAAGVGLYIAGAHGASGGRLLLGGLLTGLGVAGMHYTGMAAMNMNAAISYDPALVMASIVIAIVAATAALWAAVHLRNMRATVGAALIMGVAVSAMHYTGMFAMHVEGLEASAVPSGAQPRAFLVPIILGLSISTMCLLTALGVAPTPQEMQREARLMEQLARRNASRSLRPNAAYPPPRHQAPPPLRRQNPHP